MKKLLIPAICLSLALSGCASVRQAAIPFYPSPQEIKLREAVELIKKGKTEPAADLLESLAKDKGVEGITDEALFRLALLQLPSDVDQEEIRRSSKTLERLRKEYPSSPWTIQAESLTDLLPSLPRKLQATSELQRQIRSLKDLNLSLTRENKELRLNIEKLKTLDLELEKKTRP